jgi:tryptophan-rich sensory protein
LIVTSFWMLLKSPRLAGLALNVSLVWAALGLSVVLLMTTSGSSGFDELDDRSPRGAPWTPPGAVIGAVWTVLYGLMGVSLWAVNRTPADLQPRLRAVVLALIAFCLVWPFYAFDTTSRWPGLLGNLGVLALAVTAVVSLLPHSRLAAGAVALVAVWTSVATATIIDGAVRYGW